MAQNYKNLAFTTDLRYEHIKSKTSQSASLAVGDYNHTFTFPHGLGYAPYFKFSYEVNADGNIYEAFNGSNSFYVTAYGSQINDMYADANNVYINVANYGASPITMRVFCRIYAEPQ